MGGTSDEAPPFNCWWSWSDFVLKSCRFLRVMKCKGRTLHGITRIRSSV